MMECRCFDVRREETLVQSEWKCVSCGNRFVQCDSRSVLPMQLSDGEQFIADSISGGADYVDGMPKGVTIVRIRAEDEIRRRYVQEKADRDIDTYPCGCARQSNHDPLTCVACENMKLHERITELEAEVERLRGS